MLKKLDEAYTSYSSRAWNEQGKDRGSVICSNYYFYILLTGSLTSQCECVIE